MEQVRSNGEQKELRDEIVDLGTRYGIVTPYTSYLALENEQTSLNYIAPAPASSPKRPSGGFSGGLLRGQATKDAPIPSAAQTVTVTTGAAAVQQSKQTRAQMELDKISTDDTRTDAVQRVGGKTFYLIEGVWTDSEFKVEAKMPETVLKFGSDEYFALLKQNPKLANYFALSEQVVVVFEGRVYRVTGSA